LIWSFITLSLSQEYFCKSVLPTTYKFWFDLLLPYHYPRSTSANLFPLTLQILIWSFIILSLSQEYFCKSVPPNFTNFDLIFYYLIPGVLLQICSPYLYKFWFDLLLPYPYPRSTSANLFPLQLTNFDLIFYYLILIPGVLLQICSPYLYKFWFDLLLPYPYARNTSANLFPLTLQTFWFDLLLPYPYARSRDSLDQIWFPKHFNILRKRMKSWKQLNTDDKTKCL
jgi:hypothetical protein